MPRTLATIRSLFLAASVNVMLIVPSTTSCIAFCPQEDIAGRSIDACCEITGDPDIADDLLECYAVQHRQDQARS